ncbi:MAG TPA: potassium/proton antiporter [Spirochaetota bacterium]|nr:potassium/proton antiporter [Spirochaetota bacterium]
MILITALILLFIVFTATLSRKLNIPLIIIALVIGIVFGSDVTGLIYFDNAQLSQKIANIALVFILFSGGFGTKTSNLRPVIKPTMLLATIGVLLTAGISSIIFCLLSGWTFFKSLLLCAIISSTDAAAVFSILRTRSLNKNVASMAEIESAANDPMAIIMTTFIIQIILGVSLKTEFIIGLFIWQLVGGITIGIIMGFVGSYIFGKIKDNDVGYFYIFLIGIILFSYGIADLCKASGMLSVFFAGYIMGNKKLPYKNGISSFTEILSFISNVGLFVLLGLLVFPKQFSGIWINGILLFVILTFIARPLAVFICTFFTKLSFLEKIFLSWSGLRGAVPIVLATYPLAAGIDSEHQIFNIIFFTVTLSLFIQGSTIGKIADFLKLGTKQQHKSKQTMELVTIHDTNIELIEVFIDPDIYDGTCKISNMTLPIDTTITMISRNNKIIVPSGQTIILPGDNLSLLTDNKKIEETISELFKMFTKK